MQYFFEIYIKMCEKDRFFKVILYKILYIFYAFVKEAEDVIVFKIQYKQEEN